MAIQEICNYFKTDVYKGHPEYVIESTIIQEQLNFYLTVHLGNDYCYCFLIIPTLVDKPFDQVNPSEEDLKKFMNIEISPNCVLKKVIMIKKNENDTFEHRTFAPEYFE